MIDVPCMPDEFAPGYEGRSARINILRTAAELRPLINAVHDLPKNTPRLSALAIAAGLSTPDFVQLHTTLPCRQFVSAPTLGGIRHGDAERLKSAIQLGMTPPENRARFCRCCVDEDLAYHEFSYWRRTHHLQGIDWCPKHHVQLTEITARDAFSSLPNECLDVGNDLPGVSDLAECMPLIRLTEISVGVLDINVPASSIQVAYVLKRLLKDAGLRLSRAGSRMLLSDLAQQELPQAWLERHFPEIANKRALRYIATLDSVSRGRWLPLTHLAYLLAFALLSTSSDQALNYIRLAQNEPILDPVPTPEKKYSRDFWRSSELRQIYVASEGKHRRVAERLGVSVSHIRVELQAVGLPALVELEMSTINALLDFLGGMSLADALRLHDAKNSAIEYWLRQDLQTLKPLLKKQRANRCASV